MRFEAFMSATIAADGRPALRHDAIDVAATMLPGRAGQDAARRLTSSAGRNARTRSPPALVGTAGYFVAYDAMYLRRR